MAKGAQLPAKVEVMLLAAVITLQCSLRRGNVSRATYFLDSTRWAS